MLSKNHSWRRQAIVSAAAPQFTTTSPESSSAARNDTCRGAHAGPPRCPVTLTATPAESWRPENGNHVPPGHVADPAASATAGSVQ